MVFPFYFQKVIWMEDFFFFFFFANFFSEKPNTSEYAQVLVAMCPELNSVTAILSPPPRPHISLGDHTRVHIYERS